MQVPFPYTTTPGRLPGEGQGRLVNAHPSKEGDIVYLRRAAGLTQLATLPTYPVRGFLASGAILYVCAGDKVYRVSPNGAYEALYGIVPGSGPVTMAENNAFGTTGKALVTQQYGVQVVGDAALGTLGINPMGLVNSIARLNAYLMFTTASGAIWATGRNNLTVDALSTSSAESDRDGLVRGIVCNGLYYAMGSRTIEIWQDVGSEPFPLARLNTVIQVGLAGPHAVAGVQGEWESPAIFVATDSTVRMLTGQDAQKISTPDVEHMIADVDPANLVASVYVEGGRSFWTLSCPTWTLEYCVSSASWCERVSLGLNRWRGGLTAAQWGGWIAAHPTSGKIYKIDRGAMVEDGEPLMFGADSGPVKDFPTRAAVRNAALDFTLGRGDEGEASPTLKAPVVMVSWSMDGGANWSNAVHRSLGREGRFMGRAMVSRLGLASHHGFRLRWRVSDPVQVSFQGASVDIEARRA